MSYTHSRAFAQVSTRIDISEIAAAALDRATDVLARLLPDGRREGNEWVSTNPTRADRRPGSFKINLRNGKWSDFACGAAGGDLVALVAYIDGVSQVEAARRLGRMVGVL